MSVLSLVTEVLHEALEVAASYRLGQAALRCADRALGAVEESARWATPAPLERKERGLKPGRPLPWLLFLGLLLLLRVARESVSLVHLYIGRPPLRSADVVTYIQGKRRYLRAVKYHGGRAMRARRDRVPADRRSRLAALFSLTMCRSRGAANAPSSGDEAVVVPHRSGGGPSSTARSLERLLEKMDPEHSVSAPGQRSCAGARQVTIVKGALESKATQRSSNDEEAGSGRPEGESATGRQSAVMPTLGQRGRNGELRDADVQQAVWSAPIVERAAGEPEQHPSEPLTV